MTKTASTSSGIHVQVIVNMYFYDLLYYIGNPFIEPYGFSGSLLLFCYYITIVLYIAENKLVVVVFQ